MLPHAPHGSGRQPEVEKAPRQQLCGQVQPAPMPEALDATGKAGRRALHLEAGELILDKHSEAARTLQVGKAHHLGDQVV